MILYIVETFPSVTESFITHEIKGLIKSGLDIQVLAFRKELDMYSEVTTHYLGPAFTIRNLFNLNKIRFLACNFRAVVRLVPVKGYKSIVKFLKTLKYLWRCPEALQLIKENDIVHIHAHFATMPADLAKLLSHLSNIPFSFSSHAYDIYTQDPVSIDEKLSAARFMVTCTAYNYQYFKHRLSKSNLHKVNMIYHGIPIDNWPLRSQNPCHGNGINLLTVARLQEKKGLIYLCMAVQLLVRKRVKVKLDVVGDGPLFDQLNRFINENNLKDYIQLKGSVYPKDIKKYYQGANIFILPSIKARDGDQDGLPNVLLEALATGVPVITTAISGIKELIVPEQSGIIVPERDVKAIARAIIRLSSDKILYDKIVMNGRIRVEKFDIEKSISALNQLFIEHTDKK